MVLRLSLVYESDLVRPNSHDELLAHLGLRLLCLRRTCKGLSLNLSVSSFGLTDTDLHGSLRLGSELLLLLRIDGLTGVLIAYLVLWPTVFDHECLSLFDSTVRRNRVAHLPPLCEERRVCILGPS